MELDQFRDVDLVIDYANYSFIEKQFVSQGDYKGRTLTVQVTNNGVVGEVPGLMLNLNWHNQASGLTDLSAFSVLDKANSIYRIEYPQHMMTPGKVLASIQVIQNGKVTNLKQFELTVQKLAGQPVGIVEKAEFSALVAILADSNKFRTDITVLEKEKADKAFVDAQLAQKVNQDDFYATIGNIKDATPIFVDNTGEMTDTTSIYVNLSDGYLYVHDGSAWVNTNKQYQSTGIADGTIPTHKLSVDDLNYLNAYPNFELLNIPMKLGEYSVSRNDWKSNTDGTNIMAPVFSDYFDISTQDLTIKTFNSNIIMNIYYFNSTKTLISSDINKPLSDVEVIKSGQTRYNEPVKYIVVLFKFSPETSFSSVDELKKYLLFYRGEADRNEYTQHISRGRKNANLLNTKNSPINEIALIGDSAGGNGTLDNPIYIEHVGSTNGRIRMAVTDNQGVRVTNDIPTRLFSFEGYVDKVHLVNGEYKVTKELGYVEFDGTGLTKQADVGTFARYSISLSRLGISPKLDTVMLSNYFKYDTNYYGEFEHFMFGSNNYLFIFSDKTLEEIQTILSSKPMQILYIRATPITSALSSSVDTQIKNIQTHEENTVITSVDKTKPYIYIDYMGIKDDKDNQVDLWFSDGIQTGDCTVITHESGKVGMVDTRTVSDFKYVSKLLKELNISKLDYIIISHYHGDHIGNLEAIADLIDTSEAVCYLPPTPDFTIHLKLFPTSKVPTDYSNSIQILETRYGQIKQPYENEVIFKDNVTFEFWNANHDYLYEVSNHNYNDFSLGFYLRVGNNSVLFSGDLAEKGQAKYAKKLKKCDVYKSHHHAVDQNFLNTLYMSTIKPELIVTSGGKNEHHWIETSRQQLWCEDNHVPHYPTSINNEIGLTISTGGYDFITNAYRYIVSEDSTIST
ncbi:ComEC/Rec2 family competence protein [Enterococcus casseliflavus]|uniref:ComEC/Rec2 family competence protein n=1 Tax=Enterococcus casseliflavus TaxID=37734 RepID=UPI0039A4A50D